MKLEVYCVIIAKPGKDDYTKARSYRIINLTSNFLKIMENSYSGTCKKI